MDWKVILILTVIFMLPAYKLGRRISILEDEVRELKKKS